MPPNSRHRRNGAGPPGLHHDADARDEPPAVEGETGFAGNQRETRHHGRPAGPSGASEPDGRPAAMGSKADIMPSVRRSERGAGLSVPVGERG